MKMSSVNRRYSCKIRMAALPIESNAKALFHPISNPIRAMWVQDNRLNNEHSMCHICASSCMIHIYTQSSLAYYHFAWVWLWLTTTPSTVRFTAIADVIENHLEPTKGTYFHLNPNRPRFGNALLRKFKRLKWAHATAMRCFVRFYAWRGVHWEKHTMLQ